MPEWSRRRALQTIAAGTAVAIAGCRERNLFAEETPDVRRRRAIENYEVRHVRDADARPIFWTDEQTPPTDSGEGSRQSLVADEEFDYNLHTYLSTTEDRASVTFAPESEASDRLRAFVEATTFAEQSVALVMASIAECRDLRLQRVTREPDGYDLSFCRPFRSADTSCDATADDTVAVAVRLPFTGDGISGRGTSWHRECRERPLPVFPETPTEGEDV